MESIHRSNICAISPIDGRYATKTEKFKDIFSEYGLIRNRIIVEIKWLESLCANDQVTHAKTLSTEAQKFLNSIIENFSYERADKIKEIEKTTNHDVKSVEYFLKDSFVDSKELKELVPFIHFGCTSEDINNLSHGLMLKEGKEKIILPEIEQILARLSSMSQEHAGISMLSRTHGQTASPTTLGKEMANFFYRLTKQLRKFEEINLLGKMNGAVGNYNAHLVAYPGINWREHSEKFISDLGLCPNPYTTQIEPHDYMAEYFNYLALINTIIIDLCRDIWGYISLGYFKQKLIKGEIGSSTMPHKVNPIDFENAEGNLGIANSLLKHFSEKLPISRWQRDLTDSTVLRNMGVALAYSSIGYQSLLKGLKKLEVNEDKLSKDLNDSYEVLAEAIQTVMRKHKVKNPYEKLKKLTRGNKISPEVIKTFIDTLEIPKAEKDQLKEITPHSYLGNAETLAKDIDKY